MILMYLFRPTEAHNGSVKGATLRMMEQLQWVYILVAHSEGNPKYFKKKSRGLVALASFRWRRIRGIFVEEMESINGGLM